MYRHKVTTRTVIERFNLIDKGKRKQLIETMPRIVDRTKKKDCSEKYAKKKMTMLEPRQPEIIELAKSLSVFITRFGRSLLTLLSSIRRFRGLID